MSPPGAVRLVQRLEQDRLIARKSTSDGRTVALHLTVAGRKRRATGCLPSVGRSWSGPSNACRLRSERSWRRWLKNCSSALNATHHTPMRSADFVGKPSAIPARWLTGKPAQQEVLSSPINPVLPISSGQKVVNDQMRYFTAQALSGGQVRAKMDAGENPAQGSFLGSRRKSLK